MSYKQKLEKDKEAAESALMMTMEKLICFFKKYQAIGDNFVSFYIFLRVF